MMQNRLLAGSLVGFAAYWLLFPFLPVAIGSVVVSAALAAVGGLTLWRYAPVTWRVVIGGLRHHSEYAPGAHLGVYGLFLLAAGSLWTGVYGMIWNAIGQPEIWIGTAASAFGRALMAVGFAMMYLSPEVSRDNSKVPGLLWISSGVLVAILTAGIIGYQMGAVPYERVIGWRTCPASQPYHKAKNSDYVHGPESPFYDQIYDPDGCYESPEAAEAAGWDYYVPRAER